MRIERYGGGYPATTNQRMELKAVYEALLWAARESQPGLLHIYSDSAYVVNCFHDGWWRNWMKNGWLNSGKKPVANAAAWRRVIRTYQECLVNGTEVAFHKVPGHSDNEMNNRADELAGLGRKEGQR